jgi:ribonuclease PH
MTGEFGLVEMQGTAEGVPFSREDLDAMVDLAQQGILELIQIQKKALGAG